MELKIIKRTDETVCAWCLKAITDYSWSRVGKHDLHSGCVGDAVVMAIRNARLQGQEATSDETLPAVYPAAYGGDPEPEPSADPAVEEAPETEEVPIPAPEPETFCPEVEAPTMPEPQPTEEITGGECYIRRNALGVDRATFGLAANVGPGALELFETKGITLSKPVLRSIGRTLEQMERDGAPEKASVRMDPVTYEKLLERVP